MMRSIFGLLISPLFVLFVVWPEAWAQLNDFDRQEFTFENALAGKNPGFESGTVQWTASGGTFAVNSGTQIVPNSKQFATWDSNSAGQTLQTAAVTVPKTGNCEFSIWIAVPSGTATHTITVNDGTNDLVSAWTITTNSNALKHIVKFPCPSSGTVRGKLTSVASNEPSISLDNARLGSATNIYATQNTTEWQSFNTSGIFAGFTPGVSTAYGKYRQVGNMVEGWIEASFGATQTAGTSMVITLPWGVDGNAFVSASTKRITFGDVKIAISGSRFTGQMISDATTDDKKAFTLTWDTASGTVNSDTTWTYNNIATINSGDGFRVDFKYPVKGWTATGTVITPNAQGLSWSGTHGNDCIWTTTSSSLAAIGTGDAGCTFTQLSNRNFGTVTSATASGNNIPGIVFTPVVSGRYFICVNAHAHNSTAVGNYSGLAIHDGTSIIASSSQRNGRATTGTNDEMPHAMCGIATLNAGASRTVQLYANASAGTTTLAAGAAGVANVTWSIFNVDQPVQAILANSVISNVANGIRIEGASIDNTGTATVTRQTGSWIDSVSRTGTGVVEINYSSSLWSVAPICTLTINAATLIARVESITTTKLTTRMITSAGTSTDNPFYVQCMGPR